ncbi:MAG: 50S ribosomal protein L18 [Bacteroidales bacterium]|nr:50S ribosomal protein L18 [Bacteroidales bacterium]
MAIKNKKEYRRTRIKIRIRKRLFGTSERPRMSVFRSNKEIYVQFIDDINGKTIAAASSMSDSLKGTTGPKLEVAGKVGKLAAENALSAGISTVVFDRNGYLYHGRVKALADAAREGGLKF